MKIVKKVIKLTEGPKYCEYITQVGKIVGDFVKFFFKIMNNIQILSQIIAK